MPFRRFSRPPILQLQRAVWTICTKLTEVTGSALGYDNKSRFTVTYLAFVGGAVAIPLLAIKWQR